MKNKINRSVSVLLTLTIVLSVCVCAIGTVSAATATYYVSASGDDANTGISIETAVASYAKAIELANASYGAGDTVTIKLTGESVEMGTIPEYAYDLVVEGIDATETKLSTTSARGGIANNQGGTTQFKNMSVVSTQSYPSFLMNNTKNVIFDSTFSGFSSTKYAALGTYNDGGAKTTIGGQNVKFNSSVGIIYLGNSGWQNKTVTDDVNVTVAGGGSPNFYFNPASNASITFKKNLNLNIKSASSVSFDNIGSVTAEGAIQIINSTNATVTSENTVLAAIDCNKYIITNITGKSDIIEFTETAGKFKVDTAATEYQIIATDKNGTVTKVDEQGYLNLTATGDYTLSLYREPKTAIYYVSAKTGSQFTGNGTKANPYKFVSNAITKAVEDGYTNKDTVIVKLLDEKTIQWGEDTQTPAHPFKLIVESDDRNNYCKVNIMHGTYLGGTTEVRYGAYEINNTYSQLRINNYDFTIGEGANFKCLYYTFGDNSTTNTIAGHNVVFKNDISSPNIYLSNILHSNKKHYSGDVNVTIDNPYAAPTIRLCGQDGTVYYDANVNLYIKDASRVSFGSQNTGKNVCNGAVQLIVNSKTSVDPDGIEYLKTTCNPTDGFYHIINASKIKDLLTFTTTAGKYAVDTEKYDVTASDGTNEIKAKDGFLTLTAGTYTVTATQIKEDSVPVISEKLEGTVINLWEQANNELNIDNAETTATIDFGDKTYNDVKINVLKAKKIIFKGTPDIKGSLHIAVNRATTVEGKSTVDAIAADNGKWYVVNNSGSNISFGDELGEVLYTTSGKELEAVSGSNTIAPKFQNFLLKEGEYTIRIKSKSANKYNDYIKYRGSNLANTYAKIKNGEKLNVVYFGGSVTNGTGASSPNATSWRALVGQWLKNTYQDVEINNINSAIGATGTTFGSYRLNRYVIDQKPDLLFIEFSVNDYYDLHYTDSNYRERSAMQLETIIRQVRKELPECDIVVLHTLEKVHIPTARYGGLYPEAQAHYDIAEHYNVPTINLGAALANALPENWESVWSEYVTDLVHPTDKGYAIYYNTVKEYISNCLLYTKHTGKVANHAIPEMISSSLRNGDIQYIDASKELLEKSEALGGTGFKYGVGEIYLNKDFGSITSSAGDNSVIAVEFIGTELTMAINGSSNIGGFKVKVDNGEYKNVASVNVSPRIMTTGLTSGKHTVYIKPISSSSGTALLNIIGFYTRDESKSTIKCTKHSYTKYTNNNDATCQANGTKTAYCDKCYTTNTLTIADSKLPHTYDNENDAICNSCGANKNIPLGSQLIKEGDKYVYYVDGIKSDITELVKIEGVWYYIENGVWATTVDTLHKINGKWFLIKGGKWKATTGLVEYKGKTFYVVGGKWNSDVNDLKKINGKWYFIKSGKWDSTLESLHKLNGKWFLVKGGMWKATTGLVKYKGKQFYVVGGKWQSRTGIYKINSKNYYIKGGKWDKSINTLYKKSGKLYAVKNGMWYKSKAIIKYSGKKYYCDKGYAQTSKSGKVKVSGKTYTIKKGIVK